MSKAIDKLTDDEVLALYRFMQKAGRSWRARLGAAWTTGDYPAFVDDVGTLRQLHKRGGASIVVKVECKEIVEAGQAVEKAYGQVSA